MEIYDTIVIGLGGMGSSAAYRLAQRGQRVLGIDRFEPVHTKGASHGGSRITLRSYFAGPRYVPLLTHSQALWKGVAADADTDILTTCGGLVIGRPDAGSIVGGLASATFGDVPHELLDATEIRRRFPTMRPDPDEVAIYEPGAGIVVPEAAVSAHLKLAAAHGAELRHGEEVLEWRQQPGGGVVVRTTAGRYEAAQLVICPGGWAPELLSDLGVRFAVERQVQYWFAPSGDVDAFLPDRQPLYIWEPSDGRVFYGFPIHQGARTGAKVAFFRAPAEPCTADTLDRSVTLKEVRTLTDFVAPRIPALTGTYLRAVACMYTTTPDMNAVIARHPAHESVVVACGFSGHGFKLVPIVGEVLADLVIDGSTKHDISLFDPSRFAVAP